MRVDDELGRRQLCTALLGLLGGTLGAKTAAAQPGISLGDVPPLEIDLPQLQYPGDWNPRPGALRELGIELRLRTRLEPFRQPSVVKADDSELFATPFLYIAGESGFPNLGGKPEAALRRFVDLGGMLVFDAADGGTDTRFLADVRKLLERVLPGSSLVAVPRDHVLYRSFYIIDEPTGRTRTRDHALGIQEEGRIKVLFLPNDLGGALSRNEDGLYRHPCTPGGADQREYAIRFGINLLLYATCTDYKSDRAHVETLLRSRRWR
jgi:hypothetical protein